MNDVIQTEDHANLTKTTFYLQYKTLKAKYFLQPYTYMYIYCRY